MVIKHILVPGDTTLVAVHIYSDKNIISNYNMPYTYTAILYCDSAYNSDLSTYII